MDRRNSSSSSSDFIKKKLLENCKQTNYYMPIISEVNYYITLFFNYTPKIQNTNFTVASKFYNLCYATLRI